MYGNKVYINFCGLNMPEDVICCFIVISIDSLLVYKNKFYLQLYLDSCAYKIVDNGMIDYLDENPLRQKKISFWSILINVVLQ